MEVVEPERTPAVAGPARSRAKVSPAAVLPVVTVYFWLCLVYAWEAWGALAPWLNSDEFERAELSRAVAATGHEGWRTFPHGFDSLYVYLIAPVWWLQGTSEAYGAAKAIGVAAMAAVVFPVYLLARMLVGQRWALFAAAGAAMIPALAYSSMLMFEPLAYPWAALCFYLLAKAFVTRRPLWIAAAAAACVAAPLIRTQLGVLSGAALAGAALFWFVGDGGRRLRRNWGRWHWTGFTLVVICAAVVLDVIVAHYSHVWSVVTRTDREHMLTYGLRSAGALTIGLGVLPLVAGLTALVRPRGEAPSREHRAFTSIAVAMLVSFGLYAAAKSAYISTLGLTEFVERNLIYLAPLLFVGTAFVLERRRPVLPALLAATAFALYLVTTTPYHMDIPVFFDAPGLAVLPGLNRGFGLSAAGAKTLLVVLALGSAALVAFVRFASRTGAVRAAAVAAGVVLVWNVYGEVSFARSAHKVAKAQVDNLPRPLDWVDRAVPDGTRVTYLGQSIDDPFDVLQLEFWNRSLGQVWSTDGTAPGPGPTVKPDIVAPDGELQPSGVEYMVADSGVTPVGQVIERKEHRGGRGVRTWTLLHVSAPLRLRQSIEGVYPDGWGKPVTALNQFSLPAGTGSAIRVHVFRTGAARRYPATIRVTVGTLTLVGPTGGRTPAIASVVATQTFHVRNNLDHTFVLDAPPPPFRVETSVTPFPHDRDPRIGDPRDLGANVVYTVHAT